jgi:hypothetical protein
MASNNQTRKGTTMDADFVLGYSPGAIVVNLPECGGKRVGAHTDVTMTPGRDEVVIHIAGVVEAFYDENRKRCSYRRSRGVIIRPTTYGAGYYDNGGELVDCCWYITPARQREYLESCRT